MLPWRRLDRERRVDEARYPEQRHLRRIEDRLRAQDRAQRAWIRDRERPALELRAVQRASAGARRQVRNPRVDLLQRQGLSVTQDGHDEPLCCIDGYAEIDDLPTQRVGVGERGIEIGMLLQQLRRRVRNEAQHRDARTVLSGLQACARREQRSRVDLHVGGELRRRAHGIDEPARDGTAACAVRFPHDRHVFVTGRSRWLR